MSNTMSRCDTLIELKEELDANEKYTGGLETALVSLNKMVNEVLTDNQLIHEISGRTIKEGLAPVKQMMLEMGDQHPGYVIGCHWLSAAYDRICAGEDEVKVMLDFRYKPIS